MDGQDRNSVRQEAVASTHSSVQIPENTEADAEKRNDLLERSVILNMEDNEVFTPENDGRDSDARKELEKNARVDKELRKISSTNPAGTKESINLPPRRSQKPTLPVARQKYEEALNRLSAEVDDYLSLHGPREFIQENERPEASRRFKKIKRQLGATLDVAEDLFNLLASNADTLAQNDLRRQVDDVEERITAIHLGHQEYYSEMSTSFAFADEWRGKRINVNNRSPSVTGSTRSREDRERGILDKAVDIEEQRRLDELEMKEREVRRLADLERDKIALQMSGENVQGYSPEEVIDRQTALPEDRTQNTAAMT